MLHYRPFSPIAFKELHQWHEIFFHVHIIIELIPICIVIRSRSSLPQRQDISTPRSPGPTTRNSIDATVSGRSVDLEVVIIKEAEERG